MSENRLLPSVPEGAKSARIVLHFRVGGTLTVHKVEVLPIDPAEIRPIAKVLIFGRRRD